MSNAKYQAAYRAREAAKAFRRVVALEKIVLRLRGDPSPLAVEILAIAERGLCAD